jgi:hypothetical protein
MRNTNIKLKNKNGENVVYIGISTVSIDGEDGTKKQFSLGNLTEGTIVLDFANGNQEVIVPDDELYDKVVILKPETFIAENIAQGVNIAGIEGTFEGAREMPTLNVPSISRSSDTITITNPSTNGNFNKGFNVYFGGELAFYQTGTTFSLISKFEAEKDYSIQASCVNPLMNESGKSGAIVFSIYSINKVFDEYISTTDTSTKISNGLKYKIYLKSAFGYWLPEIIKVYKKMNGTDEYEVTDEFFYSMYTGEVSFDSIDSNVKIEVIADEEPHLKRPKVRIVENEFILKTSFPIYSQKLLFYDNEEFFHEEVKLEEPIAVMVESLGTTYTFIQDSDGYYKPTNTGVNSSFALARIQIVNSQDPKSIKLLWMQSTEYGYDYGLIGKMDVALSQSTNVDSDVLLNAQNQIATTPMELWLEAPTGTHFYDVKYRKDGGGHSGWDMFQFQINIIEKVFAISSDRVIITDDYVLKLSNIDYAQSKSANVTHHVYLDDVLTYAKKEGI